jgi:hypothetical protein
MIPKELQRDNQGYGRINRIKWADAMLADARAMAATAAANPDRGFADYADPDCTECDTPGECGGHRYDALILDAANAYRLAGLGLLAERVEDLEDAVPLAWTVFDEDNANTEV